MSSSSLFLSCQRSEQRQTTAQVLDSWRRAAGRIAAGKATRVVGSTKVHAFKVFFHRVCCSSICSSRTSCRNPRARGIARDVPVVRKQRHTHNSARHNNIGKTNRLFTDTVCIAHPSSKCGVTVAEYITAATAHWLGTLGYQSAAIHGQRNELLTSFQAPNSPGSVLVCHLPLTIITTISAVAGGTRREHHSQCPLPSRAQWAGPLDLLLRGTEETTPFTLTTHGSKLSGATRSTAPARSCGRSAHPAAQHAVAGAAPHWRCSVNYCKTLRARLVRGCDAGHAVCAARA